MQLNEAQLERYPITTKLYHQMIEQGILTEDDKLELLEGEFIKMSAIGPRHLASVARLVRYLVPQILDTAMVSPQSPLELSQFNEPEPDIAIVKFRPDFYRSGIPKAEDALLIIEVADTTLPKDRGAKLAAYASTGIQEFWIINLQDDLIEVYTNPKGNTYQTVRLVRRDESLSPQALPTVTLTADEVLG